MAEGAREVAIVDCGLGNLFSVARACEHAGLRPRITSDREVVERAPALILPGVGAFGDAMARLRDLDLIGSLRDFVAAGKPFLGVCLGLQLLMSESDEFGSHRGLGLIPGRVKRLSGAGPVKVPHVGWSAVRRPADVAPEAWRRSPLAGVPEGASMYFVHSYHAEPDDTAVVLSRSTHGETDYVSGIARGAVFAFQFHPEKSGADGLRIYANFSSYVQNGVFGHER